MICEALSDRLPAVARGQASWDPEEAAHLADCAECQAEWALVAPIARAATPAPAMDLDRLSRAVLRELRPEATVVAIASRRRRWTRGLIGLSAAAGIAIALYSARPARLGDDLSLVPTRMKTTIPELDALLEDELKVVLASIKLETPDLTPGPLPRLGELTETELEQLLATVEG